jgi:hypothetical protein
MGGGRAVSSSPVHLSRPGRSGLRPRSHGLDAVKRSTLDRDPAILVHDSF